MEKLNSLESLQEALTRHRDLPLIFSYMGNDIASGYHITEVKSARLTSIDCGGETEAWAETVIQLWDVEQAGSTHMTAEKFVGILGHVAAKVAIDRQCPLIFEVGDSTAPMQLFTAGSAAAGNGGLRVALVPRAAACKPLLREAVAVEKQCCGGDVQRQACCA